MTRPTERIVAESHRPPFTRLPSPVTVTVGIKAIAYVVSIDAGIRCPPRRARRLIASSRREGSPVRSVRMGDPFRPSRERSPLRLSFRIRRISRRFIVHLLVGDRCINSAVHTGERGAPTSPPYGDEASGKTLTRRLSDSQNEKPKKSCLIKSEV